MPVRSLTSAVFAWPRRAEVHAAARRWAEAEAEGRPGLLALAYFGSYARDEAGVGSDLDLVAIVSRSDEPPERRGLDWNLLGLPVPAEIVVLTVEEWRRLRQEGGRFARTLEAEAVWLHGGPEV